MYERAGKGLTQTQGGVKSKEFEDKINEKEKIKINSFIQNENNVELEIEQVHLWDGVKDPYLYALEAAIAIAYTGTLANADLTAVNTFPQV